MAEHHLSESNDRSVVDARVGDTIDVRLSEHASGGYSWQLESPTGAVLGAHDPEYEFAAGKVGGGNVARFRFEVRSSGREVIRLAYRRGWETQQEPLRTCELTIMAR